MVSGSVDTNMQGSYIKIWIPAGGSGSTNNKPYQTHPQSLDYGYVNHTYKESDNDNVGDLVSLERVPIEERISLLLKQNGINYINRTMGTSTSDTNTSTRTSTSDTNTSTRSSTSDTNILIQIFVPEIILEDILIGLQKCGVGVEQGTGLSLVPTVVNYFGEEGDQPDYSSPQTSTTRSITSNNNKELRLGKFYRSIKSRLIVAEVIKR